MDRARRAVVLALLIAFSVGPKSGSAAVVTWPPSTLLVSEVMTGGTSASDEFVEVTNAGPVAVDLVGIEVAYVTASGSTITRKGSWAESVLLEPGRHLLLANALGAFASGADATWSGGIAATGGAMVLRPIGGAPIDAVGWGDAVSGFVEGSVAPAPPAGSSLERRPGGSAGNGSDSNDNLADWFVQGAPSPQNLAAPPTPVLLPTPDPSASPTPTPTPTPTTTLLPTPTPTPTATATPKPTPTPMPIAGARGLPDDSVVTIAGTLTTALGALESGRTAFVQDSSGGISLYLDVAAVDAWPAGTTVLATGTLDSRFAQRTLRLAVADLARGDAESLPVPIAASTGFVGEEVEGQRLVVAGTTVGSPTAMADGTGLLVDDGGGPLRLVVAPAALGDAAVPSGTTVVAIGPLGQRDSTGTGLAGYRLHVTEPGDLVLMSPTPTPTATPPADPTPSPTPSHTTAPTPTPGPTPTPTPTPTPAPASVLTVSIVEARATPIGSIVVVGGVVTAEAGRLGALELIAIDDGSAGIVVKLPPGTASPARGTGVEVRGTLAAPYGQLELRPEANGFTVEPPRATPVPMEIAGGHLGESVEARLVTVRVTIDAKPKVAKSGDLSIATTAADGTAIRVLADASSGLAATTFAKGQSYELTGIAGQRATRNGALDGYRIWLRDGDDVDKVSTAENPAAAPSSGTPSATGTPLTAPVPIARALLARSGAVTIEGVVTVDASVLDATGRRIVLEDASAAVEVLVPAGGAPPGTGSRVKVTGTMARAYGAPRLKATELLVLGPGRARPPVALRGAPGPAHEWRLVRLSGTIVDVQRLGARWRIELQVGKARVPVTGLEGARIPVTILVEGRQATVLGIVKRPYPSAKDRRLSLVPRSPADVAIGPAEAARPSRAPGMARHAGPAGPPPAGPIDVDLARLADHVGETVRVGGLIVDLAATGVSLDDGTAVAGVVLEAEAAQYLPLLEPGDAINATGRVERRGEELVVALSDPAGLARVGDLAELPSEPPAAEPEPILASAPPAAPRTASSDSFGLGIPGTAGLASLVLISLASVGVTLLRHRRLRHTLLVRALARLPGARRQPSPIAPSSGHSGGAEPL